ncbi:hypothetical protein BOX37_04640 [Nocardia mangyaensis]|uniref:Uncharacterized protein n=1 Tax=Nocardia mangyaensis TaxID=2213200 RepID=A0A1J0VMV7_9NOCA|nr:hypothetical protein [Nocardia mangyaensis]APE33372.1 hypothetical protein BOX37_04640 [Nocardia mangyaensis]
MGTGLFLVGLGVTGYAAALLVDPDLSCHRIIGSDNCASGSYPLSAAQRDQVTAYARMLLLLAVSVAICCVAVVAVSARVLRRIVAEEDTAPEIPERPTVGDIAIAVIGVALGALALAGGFEALMSSVLPTCQGVVMESAATCPTTGRYGLAISETAAKIQGRNRLLSTFGLMFGVLLTGAGLAFGYSVIDDIRSRRRHREVHAAPPSVTLPPPHWPSAPPSMRPHSSPVASHQPYPYPPPPPGIDPRVPPRGPRP